MRVLAVKARGHGALGVRGDIKFNPKLIARSAGFAFTNYRELGRLGCSELFNLRLKSCRLGQLLLQHRHVHNPGQRVGLGVRSVEHDLTASIAVYLHFEHRCGVLHIGPAAQRFEQRFGFLVQGIGPDIAVASMVVATIRDFSHHQCHLQPLFGQQQRQRAPDDATATDANVESCCQ